MFNRLYTLLLLVFFAGVSHTFAQPDPIPVIKDTTKTIVLSGQKHFLFTVKQGQTLYSIAKAYSITVDDIFASNPTVKDAGLKTGQTIKLPSKHTATATAVIPPANTTTTATEKPTIQPSNCLGDSALVKWKDKCKKAAAKKDSYTIGLFVPLHSEDEAYNNKSSVAIEFYEGALMAAEDFSSNTVKLNIRVFDTKNDSSDVKEILESKDIKSLDLIVGPLFASAFQKVAVNTLGDSIVCVSPFSQTHKVIEGHPNAHKVTPSAVTIVDQCSKYIVDNYGNKNIIFISTALTKDGGTMTLYRDRLTAALKAKGLTLQEHKYTMGSKLPVSLFSADKENLVVFPSNDQAMVSLVIGQLDEAAAKYKVSLWGLNQWQFYDNLEPAKLTKLKLLFARTNFADMNNSMVEDLNKRCMEKYKTNASEYFIQGYDIMFYYATMLKKYGKNLTYCLPCEDTYTGLQTDIKFGVNDKGNGLENIAISIMQYLQNDIVKVNR